MPVTRARTSTSREPAVWPTYSKVAGTDCGCTVTIATSGARMPACGCELAGSQPERMGTTNATANAEAAAKWKFPSFMSYSLQLGGCEQLAPGLLTTLCQEQAFHVGCGGPFRR